LGAASKADVDAFWLPNASVPDGDGPVAGIVVSNQLDALFFEFAFVGNELQNSSLRNAVSRISAEGVNFVLVNRVTRAVQNRVRRTAGSRKSQLERLIKLAKFICRKEHRLAGAFGMAEMDNLSRPIAAAVAAAELVIAVFAAGRTEDVARTVKSAARVRKVAIFLAVCARAKSEAEFKIAGTGGFTDFCEIFIPKKIFFGLACF
jgi:hypothetical protein